MRDGKCISTERRTRFLNSIFQRRSEGEENQRRGSNEGWEMYFDGKEDEVVIFSQSCEQNNGDKNRVN